MKITNTSCDIMEAILYFYPDESFKNEREKIHNAFFKIREKHFDILKSFIFKKNILFNRSRILDEVLHALQPDSLGKLNPTYDTYQIKKDYLKKRWEHELRAQLASSEAELKAIAKEMHELL